jgi:hypothetical protein
MSTRGKLQFKIVTGLQCVCVDIEERHLRERLDMNEKEKDEKSTLPRKHSLDGLACQALCDHILPNGHGVGTGYIIPKDGRTNTARTETLDPTYGRSSGLSLSRSFTARIYSLRL